MASCTNAPFRCDIIGSFLRPDVLSKPAPTSMQA